jgi:hypothetical protein
MTGALIQVVANGAQDIYLTSDPQMTFFKTVYRRHTNFSIEPIILEFDKKPKFGKKNTITISKNADLLNDLQLEVKIPEVKPRAEQLGRQAVVEVNTVESNIETDEVSSSPDAIGGVSKVEVIRGNSGFPKTIDSNIVYALIPANPLIEVDNDLLEEFNGKVGEGIGALAISTKTSIFEGVDDFLEEVDLCKINAITSQSGNNYRVGDVYKLIDVKLLIDYIYNVEEYDEFEFSSQTAFVIITELQYAGSLTGFFRAYDINILDTGSQYFCNPIIKSESEKFFIPISFQICEFEGDIICLDTAQENIEVDFVPIIDGGKLVNVEVNFKNVDDDVKKLIIAILGKSNLIESFQLEVSGGLLINSFSWVENLGHSIIDYIELEIGGQKIDRLYGDWLNIWQELTVPLSKQAGYNKMIGNVSDIFQTRISNQDNNTSPCRNLYIPLPFWFCRQSNLTIPLISLEYHEVKMNVEFRDIRECVKFGPDYCSIVKYLPPFTLPVGSILQEEFNGDIRDFAETTMMTTSDDKKIHLKQLFGSADNFINKTFIIDNDIIIKLGDDVFTNPPFEIGQAVLYDIIIDFTYEGRVSPEPFEIPICSSIQKILKIEQDDCILVDTCVETIPKTIALTQLEVINEDSAQIYFEYIDESNNELENGDMILVNGLMFRLDQKPMKVPHTLYKLPKLCDAKVCANYVYLDTFERRKFSTMKHEILIEQLQYNGQQEICNNSNRIKLDFLHPCKEIYWVAQLRENIQKNNWNNYTGSINKKGECPLVSAEILFNC